MINSWKWNDFKNMDWLWNIDWRTKNRSVLKERGKQLIVSLSKLKKALVFHARKSWQILNGYLVPTVSFRSSAFAFHFLWTFCCSLYYDKGKRVQASSLAIVTSVQKPFDSVRSIFLFSFFLLFFVFLPKSWKSNYSIDYSTNFSFFFL